MSITNKIAELKTKQEQLKKELEDVSKQIYDHNHSGHLAVKKDPLYAELVQMAKDAAKQKEIKVKAQIDIEFYVVNPSYQLGESCESQGDEGLSCCVKKFKIIQGDVNRPSIITLSELIEIEVIDYFNEYPHEFCMFSFFNDNKTQINKLNNKFNQKLAKLAEKYDADVNDVLKEIRKKV